MAYADSMPLAFISRRPTSTRPASTMHGTPYGSQAAATPVHDLAAQALPVERALAGDHQPGAGDRPREAGQLQDGGDPGDPLGAEQQECVAQPAGRTRPRSAGERLSVRELGERRQGAVERRQVARQRTLLRAVDVRRAAQPEQRVVDVGGGHQPDPVQLERALRPRSTSRSSPQAAGALRPAGLAGSAPSAARSPAPPSFVPLPPSPTTTVVAPAPIAASTSSPTPYVLAAPDVAASRGTSWSPHAWADSTYAVVPSGASRTAPGVGAPTGLGRGRHQLAAERGVQDVDESRAAVGQRRGDDLVVRSASGASPPRSPSAASTAVSVPAKPSGATRTRKPAAQRVSRPGAPHTGNQREVSGSRRRSFSTRDFTCSSSTLSRRSAPPVGANG